MESDMYPIINKHLKSEGYVVKAEVKDFDIVAIKDDVIMIIEMKNQFNIKLIYQGLKAKKITDYVYLAIPKPTNKIIKSDLFKEKKEIVKHLELGLILIDKSSKELIVILDPTIIPHKNQQKKRSMLKKEFFLRKTSFNVGGVNKTKIITAYRELALLALYFLKDGPRTAKEIKLFIKEDKIMSILQKNYYNWFERVERGVYKITAIGEDALVIYKDVIEKLIPIK